MFNLLKSKRFTPTLFFVFITFFSFVVVFSAIADDQVAYDIYVLGEDRANSGPKLEAAGHNVTYEPDVYAIRLADLSVYDQVWFVDIFAVPEPTGRTNLVNFMKSGGKLFFVGDSWKEARADLFAWRDSLFNELGAGGIEQSAEINPSQTAYYTNPYHVTSYIPNEVHFIEHGTGRNGSFAHIGNGDVIVGAGLDATGDAIAIAFDYGDLHEATNSRAVVYLNSNMYENWDKYVENLACFLGPKNKVILSAKNTSALPGNQGVVKIALHNAVEVTGVEFKISDVPDILTPVQFKTTSRTANFSISYEENASGGITAIISSESGSVILQGTGSIGHLVYTVDESVELGDSADIVLGDEIISNKFESELPSATINGIFCCEILKGDVVMDGVINVLDLVRIINIILERDPEPSDLELQAADVNLDNTINILDVVSVINIILGREPIFNLEKPVATTKLIKSNELLNEEHFSKIPIAIDTEQPIRAMEVEITFNKKIIELDQPELSSRASDMRMSSYIKDDKINMIIFSPEGHLIAAGNQPIVNLPVKLRSEKINKSDFKIKNMILVGHDYRQITVTDVDDSDLTKNNIPENYFLAQNYPNPFNSETDISYNLPQSSLVELSIYNLLGEKIVTLVNKKQNAGHYTAHWNGLDNEGNEVPTGIYIYQLNSRNYVKTRKLTILK